MRYLKKYKFFENLSKIDLKELDNILIDFKQMGLEYKIEDSLSEKSHNIFVIDWKILNDDRKFITGTSLNTEKCVKSINGHSFNIDIFTTGEATRFNIEETNQAYEMVKDYLSDVYGLKPNYIYIAYYFDKFYFENFEKVSEFMNSLGGFRILGSDKPNYFNSTRLTFGFYK